MTPSPRRVLAGVCCCLLALLPAIAAADIANSGDADNPRAEEHKTCGGISHHPGFPQADKGTIQYSDAAFVGRVSEKVPTENCSYKVTFEVETDVKQNLGPQVVVHLFLHQADNVNQGDRIGMHLRRQDGLWRQDIFEIVPPEMMLKAAKPLPKATGSGDVKFLASGPFVDTGIASLNASGRVVAYGSDEFSSASRVTACPGGKRSAEIAWQGPAGMPDETPWLVIRDLRTLKLVRQVRLPDSKALATARTIWCEDEDGRRVVVVGPQIGSSRVEVVRLNGSAWSPLFRGVGDSVAALVDGFAVAQRQEGSARLVRLRSTGSVEGPLLQEFEIDGAPPRQIVSLETNLSKTRLAGMAESTNGVWHLFVVHLESSSVRSAVAQSASEMTWAGERIALLVNHLEKIPDSKRSGRGIAVFDSTPKLLAAWNGWYGGTNFMAIDDTVFDLAYGEDVEKFAGSDSGGPYLIGASVMTGPQRVVRDLNDIGVDEESLVPVLPAVRVSASLSIRRMPQPAVEVPDRTPEAVRVRQLLAAVASAALFGLVTLVMYFRRPRRLAE